MLSPNPLANFSARAENDGFIFSRKQKNNYDIKFLKK